MFEQSLKNIDDILRADNAGSALDYIEQTSWILFLKYLDDLEKDKEKKARDSQVKNISIFWHLNFSGVFGLVQKGLMVN